MGQVRNVLFAAVVLLAIVAGCTREKPSHGVMDDESLLILARQYLAEDRRGDAFSVLGEVGDIGLAVEVAKEANLLEEYVCYTEKQLDKEPTNSMYALTCYLGSMHQGNMGDAVKYLIRLRDIYIESDAHRHVIANCYYLLSVQYTILGMLDDALDNINLAIRYSTFEYSYYDYRGEILMLANRNQQFVAFAKANEGGPWSKNIDNQCNLGWVYFRLGKLDEAKKVFDNCILMMENEDYSYCLYARGYINKQQGLNEAAKKDFSMALKMAEENDNVLVMMRANYYLGNEEKALAIADSVFEEGVARLYYDASCIYALCEKTDLLVDALNNIYEKKAYSVFTYNDVNIDRDFDKVRDDKGFQKAMSRFRHHYDKDREMVRKM